MNHQELRDLICGKKPRYNAAFKPLMERISTKGDTSGKGDFSTFGAFYQTYMYAYIPFLFQKSSACYMRSGAEKPSTSIHVSSTSLVSIRSPM